MMYFQQTSIAKIETRVKTLIMSTETENIIMQVYPTINTSTIDG